MKKVIAIVITVFYLCFTTGALIRGELNMLSYEKLIDGRSNENNETETSKGVEVFHIHQAAKTWSRLKVQYIRQNIAKDNISSDESSDSVGHLTSHNNSVIIYHPLFLKNRVFRL